MKNSKKNHKSKEPSGPSVRQLRAASAVQTGLNHILFGGGFILDEFVKPIPSPKLNKIDDFESEDTQGTKKYVSTAEPRENHLDDLKMGGGMNFSITNVDISPDFGNAKVYIIDSEASPSNDLLINTLNAAVPKIRFNLAQEIDFRKVPMLKFVYDKSVYNTTYVNKLLDEVSDSYKDDEDQN